MASLRLSDFPLPVSPLSKCRVKSDHDNVTTAAREGQGYSRQNDALILGGPPHVVVCIVSKLEYVWWEGLLVIRYAAMLGGVLVKNRVGVGCHELVRIYSDEGRAADARINGIREEPFTNTRNDGIVGKG
jgi:hypothetical protein